MAADFRRRFIVSLVPTVPILIIFPMIQAWTGTGEMLRFPGDLLVFFLFSTAVFLYGGYPFYRGLYRELRGRRPGMMTLIGVANTIAYACSSAVVLEIGGISGKVFFWELATLIDVMLLGHWVEMRSVMDTSRALEEPASPMPETSRRWTSPISRAAIGWWCVPADGIIREGETSVDESLLTGESEPVHRGAGDGVIGGSVNGEGFITIEVEKTGEDYFVSQVIDLVKQAQQATSKTQSLGDRAAMWLTAIALSCGFVTLVAWFTLTPAGFPFALERSVTVMVITCPHALGLAVPLVVAVSTTLATTSGFIIRNRTAFEDARNIGAVVFDKTGTITGGEFGVRETACLTGDCDPETLLRYTASLEQYSDHPIARAIVDASDISPDVRGATGLPGEGIRGVVGGREVMVVSPGYVREHDRLAENDRLQEFSYRGMTVVYVLLDGGVAGAIALADIIRPESKQVIKRLKEAGVRCMMLTGDRHEVAEWLAGEIGIDEFFAEVLPPAEVGEDHLHPGAGHGGGDDG